VFWQRALRFARFASSRTLLQSLAGMEVVAAGMGVVVAAVGVVEGTEVVAALLPIA
jgi:hypothetical protein